ncbi:unnamed protein product, partial [marine sediment metagenome]
AESVPKSRSLVRNPVDVRGRREGMPRTPKLVPAQIIDEHDNDIGAIIRSHRHTGTNSQ